MLRCECRAVLGLIEVHRHDNKVKADNGCMSFLHSDQLLWFRQRKGGCLEWNKLGLGILLATMGERGRGAAVFE